MIRSAVWLQTFGRAARLFAAVLAVGAIWATLLAGPPAGAVEKLAIAHLYPENLTNNEVHPAMVYFKTLLEERTGGFYEVEIFAGGQLGNEVETLRETQDGVTIQMTIPSSGAFSSFYRKYQAIVAPYLFPDKLTAWAFFDSAFMADFMGGLPEIGLRYLGTMDDGGGFVVLTNSLRPVYSKADLVGMRVRTEENPSHMAIMNAMGASATPMAWGDVIPALATQTAHAQFNAPVVIAAFNLWDVQKYVTYLNHIYNTLNWVVSETWFQAQSEAHRLEILRASREAILYSRALAAHLSIQAVEESKKKGMVVNTIAADDLAELRRMSLAGYREWAIDEFGLPAELVDGVRAEVARIHEELGRTYLRRYAR
ncbi:MAG: TRAP transporter substrate-binding protein DctP [SAR324 cluster bacterium]|nr:TRAP transporter substrate-binding protein DctP [SAR324 cluster bacterium]